MWNTDDLGQDGRRLETGSNQFDLVETAIIEDVFIVEECESQLSSMCQMFSTGVSSGHMDSSGASVMFFRVHSVATRARENPPAGTPVSFLHGDPRRPARNSQFTIAVRRALRNSGPHSLDHKIESGFLGPAPDLQIHSARSPDLLRAGFPGFE
jgi:hypothetical protein